MKKYKPVSVSKNAFAFCRYGIAVLIWLSLIFQIKWLVLIVFLIFAVSVILKIQKSPMIVFYNFIFGKLIKSKEEILNESAMSFSHTVGAVLSFVCLLFLYFINVKMGWELVFLFAILKTISAFGVCPASKLYECMGGKSCCAFIKKV
jgi:hypothetical protein